MQTQAPAYDSPCRSWPALLFVGVIVIPLKDRLESLASEVPGLTDRELTDRLFGPGAAQQSVNRPLGGWRRREKSTVESVPTARTETTRGRPPIVSRVEHRRLGAMPTTTSARTKRRPSSSHGSKAPAGRPRLHGARRGVSTSKRRGATNAGSSR